MHKYCQSLYESLSHVKNEYILICVTEEKASAAAVDHDGSREEETNDDEGAAVYLVPLRPVARVVVLWRPRPESLT